MFRSGFFILSGNALTSILLLMRNLLVARFISVEDYGIAATFAVSMAVVEMMSTLGLQQQIVQAKAGDDPHFQASLQGFQVLRGAISAIVLYLLSGPISLFLGIPHVAWAYQLLAILPFLNALTHFDIHRLNRHMIFRPMIITGLLPALLSVCSIWPLNILYHDYRVLLYALLVQSFIALITSHVVAERPYRLAIDRAIVAQSIRFGWPILLNGMLLFLTFNGDKLIVGRTLGMAELAILSMGTTLTLTPILVMEQSAQTIFLPQLSRVLSDGKTFRKISLVAFQTHMVAGIFLLMCTLYFASPFVRIFLGAEYAPLIPVLILLAIMQAIHAFKHGNSPSSIAMLQTSNSLLCSLPKLLSLPVTAWFAGRGADLELIIWISILAEFFGFLITLILSQRRMGIPLKPLLVPGLLSILSMIFALHSGQGMAIVALGFSLASIWSMRALREFLREHWMSAK